MAASPQQAFIFDRDSTLTDKEMKLINPAAIGLILNKAVSEGHIVGIASSGAINLASPENAPILNLIDPQHLQQNPLGYSLLGRGAQGQMNLSSDFIGLKIIPVAVNENSPFLTPEKINDIKRGADDILIDCLTRGAYDPETRTLTYTDTKDFFNPETKTQETILNFEIKIHLSEEATFKTTFKSNHDLMNQGKLDQEEGKKTTDADQQMHATLTFDTHTWLLNRDVFQKGDYKHIAALAILNQKGATIKLPEDGSIQRCTGLIKVEAPEDYTLFAAEDVVVLDDKPGVCVLMTMAGFTAIQADTYDSVVVEGTHSKDTYLDQLAEQFEDPNLERTIALTKLTSRLKQLKDSIITFTAQNPISTRAPFSNPVDNVLVAIDAALESCSQDPMRVSHCLEKIKQAALVGTKARIWSPAFHQNGDNIKRVCSGVITIVDPLIGYCNTRIKESIPQPQ